MEKIQKNGDSYNHGDAHKEFLIDALTSANEADILAELANLPSCAPGSMAINASLDLICVKGNDGEWVINR